MRGKPRKISLPRRLVADLMRASARVAFVSLTRRLNVRAVAEARTQAAGAPGWAAIFIKAFALVARDEPTLRTLYVKWPWPALYEMPRSVAMVAIARVEDGEDCVLFERVCAPDQMTLADIDALIRRAKTAPLKEIPSFRKTLCVASLPLPLRRLAWAIGMNVGRQRANFCGNFGVTSVAAIGPGELHALSPGPFLLSYGVIKPDQTVDVVLRWDHLVCDAALVTRTLSRLEQVLNSEISAELRAICPQTGTRPVRTAANRA
ncbi:acyltransferase [Bradyrhizobium jicamae]|uniref:Acyltransferase n=1 Tax=Bradyrhizobium jicamae TaxID=280332 RepID=A0ABS5FN09_9BRAD|nr:acyltransferase [Bradyrhizobium jicamae]MBR0798187.1 acyltransferase [Bradyrhizobium jicamae]